MLERKSTRQRFVKSAALVSVGLTGAAALDPIKVLAASATAVLLTSSVATTSSPRFAALSRR